jgi:hypothetical protein
MVNDMRFLKNKYSTQVFVAERSILFLFITFWIFLVNFSCTLPKYIIYTPSLDTYKYKNVDFKVEADFKSTKVKTEQQVKIILYKNQSLFGRVFLYNKGIKKLLSSTFENWNFASDDDLTPEYKVNYLELTNKTVRTDDYLSMLAFLVTLGIYPWEINFSYRCELHGFINQEQISFNLDIEERNYASYIFILYPPSWDSMFFKPDILEYCAYSLIEKYRNTRNQN